MAKNIGTLVLPGSTEEYNITTSGSENKSSTKLYLIGTEAQSADPQITYSEAGTYVGSDGYLYSNGLKVTKVSAPTTSGGSTYGPGSSGQVLKSNGTSVYWGTDSAGTSTDTKVKQTAVTTGGPYPVLLAYSGSPTSGTSSTANYVTNLKVAAGSGDITMGTASLASNLKMGGRTITSPMTGSTEYTLTLPSKTGTVALTSDITDDKVKWQSVPSTSFCPIFFSQAASPTSGGTGAIGYYSTVKVQPSTGIVSCGGVKIDNCTIDVQDSTTCAITLPAETGTLATQEWVTANTGSSADDSSVTYVWKQSASVMSMVNYGTSVSYDVDFIYGYDGVQYTSIEFAAYSPGYIQYSGSNGSARPFYGSWSGGGTDASFRTITFLDESSIPSGLQTLLNTYATRMYKETDPLYLHNFTLTGVDGTVTTSSYVKGEIISHDPSAFTIDTFLIAVSRLGVDKGVSVTGFIDGIDADEGTGGIVVSIYSGDDAGDHIRFKFYSSDVGYPVNSHLYTRYGLTEAFTLSDTVIPFISLY